MIVTMHQHLPSSSQLTTPLGPLILHLRMISTGLQHAASARPVYRLGEAYTSVMVKRMFICIYHSIYTILFDWFIVMQTPIDGRNALRAQ